MAEPPTNPPSPDPDDAREGTGPQIPERSEQPTHPTQPGPSPDASPPTDGYELADPGDEPAVGHGSRDDGSPQAAGSATAAPASARPKPERPGKQQVLSNPPQPRARLTASLVLLACLLVAAVPMVIDLGRPAVIHEPEARALATSAETWRHQAEWDYADHFLEPLVPVYNQQPQLDANPGTTWLHLLAFRVLDDHPEASTTDQLALAGRIVSVLAGLVTVASVFWIGLIIGGLRTATLGALVCAAHPLLIYHSRLAGPEMPEMAVMVLTIAAAVWAIRPLKMPGGLWRQGSGWLLCGLSLGLAVLTAGVHNLPLILVPIVLIFALYPHRLSHLMGLVAAAIIAMLVTVPWALYVHGEEPELWQRWMGQLVPAYFENPALLGELAGRRLGLLVLVTLPWTPWIVAGLVQPISTSSAGARLRMMLGWVWFVPVALLLLGAPGEPTFREMVMIIPAAAVLVGQVIRQFSDLSDEGRHTRMWRLKRWPHPFALMFASVALPAVGHFQEGMIRAGWLPGEVVTAMPAWYWLGLGVALMLIVILSMRMAEQHHPGRAVACWAVWMIVATAVVAGPVARGPMVDTPMRSVGAEVRQATAGSPLYWLKPVQSRNADDDAASTSPRTPLDARLLFYARRNVLPVTAEQLAPFDPTSERAFVLAPDDRSPPEPFEPRRTFAAVGLTLWHAGEPSAPETETETTN